MVSLAKDAVGIERSTIDPLVEPSALAEDEPLLSGGGERFEHGGLGVVTNPIHAAAEEGLSLGLAGTAIEGFSRMVLRESDRTPSGGQLQGRGS